MPPRPNFLVTFAIDCWNFFRQSSIEISHRKRTLGIATFIQQPFALPLPTSNVVVRRHESVSTRYTEYTYLCVHTVSLFISPPSLMVLICDHVYHRSPHRFLLNCYSKTTCLLYACTVYPALCVHTCTYRKDVHRLG